MSSVKKALISIFLQTKQKTSEREQPFTWALSRFSRKFNCLTELLCKKKKLSRMLQLKLAPVSQEIFFLRVQSSCLCVCPFPSFEVYLVSFFFASSPDWLLSGKTDFGMRNSCFSRLRKCNKPWIERKITPYFDFQKSKHVIWKVIRLQDFKVTCK